MKEIDHRSSTMELQNISKQVCWWILMWEDNVGLLWIDILARCDGLNLKCLKDGFVSYKHSNHKASTGGLLWCFY